MKGMMTTTASALKAILCFIDADKTPKIAFDKDEYAKPLADKLKGAIQDRDGSQSVCIHWYDGEEELQRQFNGVCDQIKSVFNQLEHCSKNR